MIKALTLLLGIHAAEAGMPAGQYVGPVLNIYGSAPMSGLSWFTVDREGRYHGRTLARKPSEDCLSYDPRGWTGRLYPIGDNTYFARNDGSAEGYVLQVLPDRRMGASTYMGVEPVVESNLFFRDQGFRPERLMGLVEICGEGK